MSTIIVPVDPTKPYTPMTVTDAGRAAGVILAVPSKHVNKAYNVVSNRRTHGDVAKVFSDILPWCCYWRLLSTDLTKVNNVYLL